MENEDIINMKLPDNGSPPKSKKIPDGVKLEKENGFVNWFLHHFMAMKPKDVLEKVMADVFDPGIRMLVSRMFDAAKNLFIFGEGTYDDDGPSSGNTPYSAMSTGQAVKEPTKKDKIQKKFANLSFSDVAKAKKLKHDVEEYFSQYGEDGFLTVSQFYEFAGLAVDPADYPEENWGWSGKAFPKELKVNPTWNDRWVVVMPPVKYLKR